MDLQVDKNSTPNIENCDCVGSNAAAEGEKLSKK